MPRLARFLKDDATYYIESESFQKERIFKSEKDYQQYFKIFKRYKLRLGLRVYAYCFVLNSVHFVIHASNAAKIPLFMQGINQSYAMFFNGRYRRRGKVWGQRYKSRMLSSDWEIFESIKFIEFLPVHKREVQWPLEYPWSSSRARMLSTNELIDTFPSKDLGCDDEWLDDGSLEKITMKKRS